MTRPQNYAAVEAYATEYKRLEEGGFVDAVEPGAMPTALEQNREDAALGAAWRRVEAALPEGYVLEFNAFAYKTRGYIRARPPTRIGNRGPRRPVFVEGYGWRDDPPTPTAALEALLVKLEGLERP